MPPPIRFSENPRRTAPVAADVVPGINSDSSEDCHFQMTDIAAAMTVLLADRLLTPEDRDNINRPPPAVTVRRRFYRGTTAPAVDSNSADPGPGWATSLSPGTGAVWEVTATFNNNVFVPPWSAPVRISGEDGIDGLDGDDGSPGNKFFFQADAPTSVGRLVGDAWWDTDDNYKQYRWNGSAWVQSFSPMLTVDDAGRVTGLVRAGESGRDFVLVADKFQIWNGTSAFSPFEVIDNVVYIKSAVVRQLSAANLIGGIISGQEIVLDGLGAILRSSDYVEGVSGFKLTGTSVQLPALTILSGQLENNATARRYGSKLHLSDTFTADTWADLLEINVVMDEGNDAHIAASLTYLAPSTPYPTDGLLRVVRADNSEVNGVSWTVQGGKAEVISYNWYDNTPTTKYKLQAKGVGGVFQARDTAMNITVYRK